MSGHSTVLFRSRKQCCTCKKTKPVAEFGSNRSRKDRLHPSCLACVKETRKGRHHYYPESQLRYYDRNKDKYRETRKTTNLKRHHERRQLVAEMKASMGCSRCPENDPDCLDFHHIDRSTKKECVSLMHAHYSWETVLAEIEKCVVLCSNCHRKEEAKRRRE